MIGKLYPITRMQDVLSYTDIPREISFTISPDTSEMQLQHLKEYGDTTGGMPQEGKIPTLSNFIYFRFTAPECHNVRCCVLM